MKDTSRLWLRLYHFKLHPTSSHVIHMYLSTFCCYEWGHMYARSQQHYHMLQGGLCLSHGAMLYFQMLKKGPKNRRGDTLMICCQHVGQNVAHNTSSAFFGGNVCHVRKTITTCRHMGWRNETTRGWHVKRQRNCQLPGREFERAGQ